MLNLLNGDATYKHFVNFLPPGFRFVPTSAELVMYSLKNKILNQPLPLNNIIEANIYLCSPMQLSEEYDIERSGIMYFFTRRDPKFPNGKRSNRVAGNGNWKASGKSKEVAKFGSLIAQERLLVYHHHTFYNQQQSRKTDWLMKEFTMTHISASSHDMKLDNWVLCKVYKKEKEDDAHAVAFPNSFMMFGEPSQLPMHHVMQAAPSSQMPAQDDSPMPQNLLHYIKNCLY